MDRLLIALAIAIAAGVIALALRHMRQSDAPTRSSGLVPEQLDRDDFASPSAPWLVAVFSSATCGTCADVQDKAAVLASDDVAVDVVEFQARRDVHQRYRIDAVPLVVIADAAGVVRRQFLGPVTATDLWAAMAQLRAPLTNGDASA
jgi:hypothetical protein